MSRMSTSLINLQIIGAVRLPTALLDKDCFASSYTCPAVMVPYSCTCRVRFAFKEKVAVVDVDGSYLAKKYEQLRLAGVNVAPVGVC